MVAVSSSATARGSMEPATGGDWGHGYGPIKLSLREPPARFASSCPRPVPLKLECACAAPGVL